MGPIQVHSWIPTSSIHVLGNLDCAHRTQLQQRFCFQTLDADINQYFQNKT